MNKKKHRDTKKESEKKEHKEKHGLAKRKRYNKM